MPVPRDENTAQPTGQRNVWKVLGMVVLALGSLASAVVMMRRQQQNPNKELDDKIRDAQAQVQACTLQITAVKVDPQGNVASEGTPHPHLTDTARQRLRETGSSDGPGAGPKRKPGLNA